MADAIRIQDLRKTFRLGFIPKPRPVLKGITLTVREGEIFGYLGPNGAGKTTTIKCLLGLIRPDAGAVDIFGRSSLSPRSREELGFLPENPYFYDYLSAREFLAFTADLFGLARRDKEERIARLLALVGLERAADLPLRKYSRGMLQRAGLAQALINEPKLVILDEPLGGMDPLGRKEIRDIIVRFKDQGKTVFFTSHILQDIEMICDRVAIIVGGRIVKEGALSFPTAPLALAQDELLALNDDLGRGVLRVDEDLEGDGRFRGVGPEGVDRALEIRFDPVADDEDVVDAASAARLLDDRRRRVRVIAEDAVGAFEVGRVHPGERPLLGLGRRVVRGHLEYRGGDPRFFEDLPEGPALPQVPDLAAREGDDRLADADGFGPAGGLGRGEDGHVGLRIAVEEVEDGVPARVHAGDEVGPGDRRLGRQAGAEGPEIAPLLEEPAEGRQAPFIDPALRQHGIEAVEAEDDHLLGRPGPAVDLGREPRGPAEAQRGRGGDAGLEELPAREGRPLAFSHRVFPFAAAERPATSTRPRPSI